MPENKNINKDVPVEETPSNTELIQRLENFQGIQNKVLLWIIRLLPLLAVVGIFIVEFVKYKLGWYLRDWVFISWMFVGILMMLVFQKILDEIPYVITSIWSRDLLRLKNVIKPFDNNKSSLEDETTSNLLEKRYVTFVNDFETRMNSNGQWGAGFLVGAIVLYMRLGIALEPLLFYAELLGNWILWLDLIGEPLLGFVIGIILWRLFLVGFFIWQLGKIFDLNPQPGHPDQAGGLSLIGELSLWIAILLGVPGIHLGFWTILSPKLLSAHYSSGFYDPPNIVFGGGLLLGIISLSLVSFFLPLWNIHKIMLAKRSVARRQLEALGKSIHQLSQEMLDYADTLEPDEGEKMAKKLELMRQIYQRNQRYPVWPFNTSIQLKLIASQVLPVLGVVQTVSQLADLLPD